jgi:hypothetical protein
MSAYERWMVEQNVEYALEEGEDVVLARLRANGYERLAYWVERALKYR